MQRCSECKYICKENKRIIKDDKLQTLGISFSIPSGVAIVGGGVYASAPKYSATTALGGLRARYKIQNGLGAHIGDGVATRMKSGNTCITTGFHGGVQQPSSENGFENWV